ncbi:TetR/AcrR family transcriptional regulator [Solirubrobacter ginsenosidimutans]|uniref:TetR/AcrR family transcriptional regulator n=1 Tax=Solirubrobacter ginsenosidimutans TaxID=490573 RepID=A0A9X3MTT9_9ACTN|nr:TetR/AcrR family transcriptional regulator [Solirubrobacter ginsenosidimutans]MDA0162921.1 TetR/AcrR family transcriptional regulator [Solirubrobacter ginsenosidimutans]
MANRERLLDVAMTAVLRDGEKIPMATIAAEAGVGVGTLYRHFPTRELLLAALVERSFALVLENARHAAALDGTALAAVREFMHRALRDRDRFVLPLHGGPPTLNAEIAALRAEVRVVLQTILDRGVAAGEVRDDVTPIDIIVAAALLSRPLPNVERWDDIAARQIELFLAGISRR